MSKVNTEFADKGAHADAGESEVCIRLRYQVPSLTIFGSVKELTLNGSGSGADGDIDPTMTMVSDPVLKENIVRIGDHSAGVGLYLFDYKAEFRDSCGRGRKFGVMADEVERIMPEAVSIGANGYRQVNYGMLGIVLH